MDMGRLPAFVAVAPNERRPAIAAGGRMAGAVFLSRWRLDRARDHSAGHRLSYAFRPVHDLAPSEARVLTDRRTPVESIRAQPKPMLTARR